MGETEITKTSEIVKKAQTIYTEYKQAIDFIISNQASFLNDKKDVFSYIEKQKLDGFLISHLCGDKNWIYLLPDNEKLLDLFEYKKAKSRGGEYIFSLVINFEKDKVWIKFGFGNIDNPIENEDALTARSEYFKLMKDFDCFKFPDIEMYKYPSADYPEICKLTLFNRNNMEEENIEFLELFIKKFDEINQKIIQPWIDECIEKLPVL